MNQSRNKILFIKETLIKRCLSLKSIIVQLWILKTVLYSERFDFLEKQTEKQ